MGEALERFKKEMKKLAMEERGLIYSEELERDGMALCPNCGKNYLPALAKDAAGMERWKAGTMADQVWPAASLIECEQLLTGICSDECWDQFLGAAPNDA